MCVKSSRCPLFVIFVMFLKCTRGRQTGWTKHESFEADIMAQIQESTRGKKPDFKNLARKNTGILIDTQTEGRGWTSYMLKINMKLETGLKPYQKKEKVILITRKRRQRYTKIKPETINDHTWNTEMKKVKMEVMLSIFMCVLYENTTTCNQKWTLEERRVNKC